MASNNPSVRQFKTDMLELANRAKYNFHQEKLAQADELIGNIQRAIEHSISGHLSQSVRKRDVTNSEETKISVLVMAGGPLTTRHTGNGNSHDYALDEEFGNVKEEPHPFFYNTARQYRKSGVAARDRETLAQTIEENNKVRALRSSNYSNAGVTVSVGHRGAVVIQKKR